MFQPVTFTPPSSVDSIAAGRSSSLDAIGSTLASGAGRLASLGGASSAPVPGLNGMGDMRGQATGMFAEPVPYLAVTPYQRGVGQHRGEHAYLTPYIDTFMSLRLLKVDKRTLCQEICDNSAQFKQVMAEVSAEQWNYLDRAKVADLQTLDALLEELRSM